MMQVRVLMLATTAAILALCVAPTIVAVNASGQQPAASAPADLVLVNGKILTVDASDSVAEAVAISGGRIVAVGTSEV